MPSCYAVNRNKSHFEIRDTLDSAKTKKSRNKRPYPEAKCTYEKIIKVTSIQGCANQSSNYISPYI